jgi:hypothetical protein
MTTTGVVGSRWRATVTPWGAVQPWGSSATTDWFIAADDRWHRPAEETSTRQRLLAGTPVVETRVRIPSGDAVHRVYSTADAGGLTIIEVTNDSPLPIAVAFTNEQLLSHRAPTTVPPQGIDLPADTVIYPVGHRSTVTVAICHSNGGGGGLPEDLPSAEQVSRGWLAQTQRASRLQIPDAAMVDSVTAARCELLLNGPAIADESAGDDRDAASFLLGVAELVRMGDRAAIWVPDVATQLERVARSGAQIAGAVIEATARVLHAAGEHRAVADLRRMGLSGAGPLAAEMPSEPALIPSWVEAHLVTSDEFSADLLPGSFPAAWLGVDFEAHGLAIGLASSLSFAIRWHGDRPAVLWEVSGPPMPLHHASWTTGQLSGEALWSPVADAGDSATNTSFS